MLVQMGVLPAKRCADEEFKLDDSSEGLRA